MEDVSFRDPRTASVEKSVWAELPEPIFRQHLVDLQKRTNAVPIDSRIFPIEDWSASHIYSQRHTLPIEVEQQVGDDLARLVAVDEGAQSVAAVCLEEYINPPGLSIRFAALDTTRNIVVKEFLKNVSEILRSAALTPGDSSKNLVEDLYEIVIQLHFSRLLARMRSMKWNKPKYLSKSHKKPLWQDFANLRHRIGHLYTRREKSERQIAERLIVNLELAYQNFEQASPPDEFASLKLLVQESHKFHKLAPVQDFTARLEMSVSNVPTPQTASAIKSLRQIQKIGAHRRICEDLIGTAKNYPQLFRTGLRFQYLNSYGSVRTTIAYESWARTCHVHAEIQLVVHYDMELQEIPPRTQFLHPRCVGISKWLCYLCYRFLEAHGRFFPSKTHGRLYDQWTIPDLEGYRSDLVDRYRRVIKQLDEITVKQTMEEPELWRIEPMTSVDLSLPQPLNEPEYFR